MCSYRFKDIDDTKYSHLSKVKQSIVNDTLVRTLFDTDLPIISREP